MFEGCANSKQQCIFVAMSDQELNSVGSSLLEGGCATHLWAAMGKRGLKGGGMRQRAQAEARSRSPRAGSSNDPPQVGGMRQRAKADARPGRGEEAASSSGGPSGSARSMGGHGFRAHVVRLFLTSGFSGKATQTLVSLAQQAGASGVGDLATSGASGRQPGNINRDMMRILSKKSDMPPLYFAPIPTQASADKSVEHVMMPFLLPHEVLGAAAERGRYYNDIPPDMAHLQALRDKVARKIGVCGDELAPIGLHGDGVPHSKKGSIEVLSWNPCGFPHLERTLFCAIEKSF